jgi:hypothetical protein
MLTSATTKRLAFAVAATAMIGSAVMSGSATADPKQFTAAVGTGSDTTQDVMNAMAGFSNGVNYTPIQSSVASGQRQVISFDALAPAGVSGTCITTKLGAPTMHRPNGSTEGRRALSRSLDGTNYSLDTSCNPTGPVDVSGLVEFARSSSGPAAGDTGTDLTYIPFGRDAMSFGYYKANTGAGFTAPVTSLTRAQLTSLFTTGPQTIGGVRLVPCGIQLGSGTYAFWQTVTTASAAQEASATTLCNNLLGTNVRSQESSGADLKARGDALAAVAGEADSQVVIGFSAGQYIAKSNGAAPGAPPAGVFMGAISDNGSGVNLGVPVQGTAPNLTPVSSFFNASIFGRNIFNVFPTAVVTSLFGNDDIKSLFVGPTSAICLNTAVVERFGFLVSPTCGSTATKGSLISGQQ